MKKEQLPPINETPEEKEKRLDKQQEIRDYAEECGGMDMIRDYLRAKGRI